MTGCASRPAPEGTLEGWKAIAEYLRVTERTVQRWEKNRGLPVRRFKGDSSEEQSRVFAQKSEIDAWWKQNTLDPPIDSETDEPDPPPPTPRVSFRRMAYTALAVSLVLAVAVRIWHVIHPPQNKVLGIAPIRNLSNVGDSNPQQLAEGLTEELISELGRLHPKRLAVIGLSPSTGNDSKLDYRLEGTVLHSGNKVAVTAKLILVEDGTVKWGNSYQRDLQSPQDVIAIEIEIRDEITKEVLAFLLPDVNPVKQVDRQTYEAYLYGRFFWNKRTTESLFKAVTYFKKAISSDPTYAPAHAGLADCYLLLGSVPYTALRPNEAFPKSEDEAKKALELDGSLAEANVSLGYSALVYRRDFAEAEKQFHKALMLRPGYATAHEFYAYYLTAMGRVKDAVKERERARDLDPLSPLINTALGEAYYEARKFDLSIAQSQQSLNLDPHYAVAVMNLARSYEQMRNYAQERQLLMQIASAAPNEPAIVAMLGHAEAVSGNRLQARKMLSHLQQIAAQRYVSPLYFALIHIGLGNVNEAFDSLDRAYDERSEYLVFLPTEPMADPLRGDPRFAALLTRLGLSPVDAHKN
jgi:tetratricopeptide (TPR) repeat protein